MADPLPVVPARENLRTVVESNTLGGRVSGDETVSIDSLFGDISSSQRAQDTVTDIMSQMSGPKGYIERLLVDQDGNVIEGAHRLEALRRLGISEVPITRVVDPTANLDLPSMRKAIEGAGKIPSDHVNQIMSQVGDMLESTGNDPEKVFEEFTFPEGYEKYFGAALDSVANEPRPKDQPRAPLLLEGPSEEKTGKEPSKGRMFRGIGSLMRGRNILSLLQGLREGYELLPEEYQVLDEALQYLKGTQFSIDKPGIESLKELLGISPEDLGETIPLPGRTSSKDTSIKQIAAVFKKPEIFDLKEGSVNLDIGGGKFDLGTDYLRNERGVENLVFDKFNRSPEHNEEVLNRIRGTGGADSATAANVLNVIEEPEARERVIQQSYDYTKDGGKVFFQVYEGSGTGVGRETTKGWQNNKKTLEYIPEIEGIFGEGSVQRKGNIIIAIKEGSSPITIPEKIDAYHGTTAEFDAFEFLHGSGGDLGFHFGTSKQAKDRLKETTQYSPPEKRAKGKILSAELTLGKTLETPDMPSFEEWNSPRSVAKLLLGTRWGKTRKKDLKRILSEADALNKSLDDRFETAIARDETLEWNPEFNRQLDRMDVQGRMHLLTELRNLLESDGYEGIKYVNKYEDPESRSYSYVVFDPANVRIKDKAKWSQNKAAGGLIDKPLYDDRRMIG